MPRRKTTKEDPTPKEVWKALGDLAMSALKYDLSVFGSKERTARSWSTRDRMIDLIQLAKKNQEPEWKIPLIEIIRASSHVENLTKIYRRVTNGMPREFQLKSLMQIFPGIGIEGLTRSYLKSANEISERRGGSTGGSLETAREVVARHYLGIGKTTFNKLINQASFDLDCLFLTGGFESERVAVIKAKKMIATRMVITSPRKELTRALGKRAGSKNLSDIKKIRSNNIE